MTYPDETTADRRWEVLVRLDDMDSYLHRATAALAANA